MQNGSCLSTSLSQYQQPIRHRCGTDGGVAETWDHSADDADLLKQAAKLARRHRLAPVTAGKQQPLGWRYAIVEAQEHRRIWHPYGTQTVPQRSSNLSKCLILLAYPRRFERPNLRFVGGFAGLQAPASDERAVHSAGIGARWERSHRDSGRKKITWGRKHCCALTTASVYFG